jgi:hypothetical protein
VDDAATPLFLPLVERAYPGGRVGVLRAATCPSYRVTTYALTARLGAIATTRIPAGAGARPDALPRRNPGRE